MIDLGYHYSRWLTGYVERGWAPFHVVIEFKPLKGSADGIMRQIEFSIREDWYPKMCKALMRHQRYDFMPAGVVCLDFPFGRWTKGQRRVAFNAGGLHAHAAIAVPPIARRKNRDLTNHFKTQQALYTQGEISSVWAKLADPNPGSLQGISKYIFKTIAAGRISPDHVIPLPRNHDEVLPQKLITDPAQRRRMEVLSRTNLSEDTFSSVHVTNGLTNRR